MSRRWTEEEIEILKKKYPSQGSDIPELNRSVSAIRNKAWKLGLEFKRKKRWTKEEVEILKEKYPKQGKNIEELDRSKKSIYNKARKLGLNSNGYWSKKEIRILKEKYPNQGSNIPELRKNRTKIAIRDKAIDMGIKRKYLDKSKEEEIRKFYWEELLTIEEVAKEIGCDKELLARKMEEWGIKKRPSGAKRPDINPSEELSYILGVLEGDGWVYKNESNYTIALSVTSKKFAKSFANALESINLNPKIYERDRKYNYRGYDWTSHFYRAQAKSVVFYRWYKKLNLKRIKGLLKKDIYKRGFIRGFYESDGSYSEENKVLGIFNTDKKLLLFTKVILEELGYHPSLKEKGPKYFGLILNKKKEKKRFIKQINPCIRILKVP